MSPKKLDINKSIERELAEPKVPGKKLTKIYNCIECSETDEKSVSVSAQDGSDLLNKKDGEYAAENHLVPQQENTKDDFSGQSNENVIMLENSEDLPGHENETNDAAGEMIPDNKDELLQNILPGLGSDEVLEILGQPDDSFEWYTGQIRFQYGNVWVIIENNVVTCLVHDQKYEKFWGRKKYENFAPEAIIR